MIIHVDRVPVRELGMTPYEIMLSESQERMLLVCESGREDDIERIFEKWDLHAVKIGEVTDDGRVRVYWHADLVADVEAHHLVLGGGAPVYHRETRRPAYLDRLRLDLEAVPDVMSNTAGPTLLDLLGSPNIASKRWVFEQYDTMVRTNTLVGPGPSDAAVVRLKGTNKGLAVKTDCNGRYVYLNPRRGGQIAVAEAARNVVCAGGKPVAITNCLNFGNPYKPEVYWTFKEAVGGMGDACRTLGTPVTGGNVSFYNENPEGAVFPTPTIGMLGVVEDIQRDTTAAGFKTDGDAVYLLAPEAWLHREDIGGSEYLSRIHGLTAGDAPYMDLEEEAEVQRRLLDLITSGKVRSAHDVSDGGLAVTLAESVLHSSFGADIELEAYGFRLDSILFGEAQSRVVISSPDRELADAEGGVQIVRIGTVTRGPLRIALNGEVVIELAPASMREPYETAIPAYMDR